MKDVLNHRSWLLFVALLWALLAACTANGETNRHTVAERATVIVYEREGGFAGMNQEWIIHLDGTIIGPGDQQFTVPPEEVQALLKAGADPEITSIAPDSTTQDACCDQFTYTLTVISGDQQWSLSMTDTAEQPQEVSLLFFMVEELINDAQPAP